MAGKHNATGGLPVRRVSRRYLDQSRSAQEGRAGLWSGSGNTFFDHTRTMRTLDPSDYEVELGVAGRNAVAWCTPLRERGKGRVVV
jgi:hypothetical protein